MEAVIAEGLEESAVAIESEGAELSASMEVGINESVLDTEWSEVGTKLNIGSDFASEMVVRTTERVLPDIISETQLADVGSEMLQDADSTFKWSSRDIGTSTQLANVSGDISRVQFEQEGAQFQSQAEGVEGKGGVKEKVKASRWVKFGKIVMYGTMVIMTLDWIASKLGPIILASLDADDAPSWAHNMTADQKADLKAISTALPKLGVMMEGWQREWEKFKDSSNLGEVTVQFNSTPHKVAVVYILFYAISDMNAVLNNTKTIFSGTVDSLSTADVIMAMNNIFIVFADAYSMYSLKNIAHHLQVYDFPPGSDKVKLDTMVLTFKNGRSKVEAVGIKYTRFATQNTIETYMKVKVIQEIYEQIQEVVLPQMQEAAEDAFKTAAQAHMDNVVDAIRAEAWIPGVGVQMARDKFHSEQAKASEEGTAAAKKAAEDKLAELKPDLQKKAIEVVKAHTEENQKQLKMIAKLAMQDSLDQMKATIQEAKEAKK